MRGWDESGEQKNKRFNDASSEMLIRHCDPSKLNSVAFVRKGTIPTERPQPAGEVSANFS
jgi:hypothetical protein